MTLDVLICSFNKGIVKLDEVLLPRRDGVRYVVSYQYTDERYLELMPPSLLKRDDVSVYKYMGQGLTSNRNQALSHSHGDIVMFADDDTRLTTSTFDIVMQTFQEHNDIDVALFRASSYTGRPLKDYPAEESEIAEVPTCYHVSTIEITFRRKSVQGVIRFDERFGLGTKFLTCGEEDVWIYDALRHHLKLQYFPRTIVETSTMLKQSMIYVDVGVQRSHGAYTYYVHGANAWLRCFAFACKSTLRGYCHFFPMLRHLYEGIQYIRHNK